MTKSNLLIIFCLKIISWRWLFYLFFYCFPIDTKNFNIVCVFLIWIFESKDLNIIRTSKTVWISLLLPFITVKIMFCVKLVSNYYNMLIRFCYHRCCYHCWIFVITTVYEWSFVYMVSMVYFVCYHGHYYLLFLVNCLCGTRLRSCR